MAQWHSHSLCTMALQTADCHQSSKQMVNGDVTVSQSLQSSKVKITGILGIPMESLGLGQGLIWLLILYVLQIEIRV